jgi:membrane-associated protease RseP (regulator of RpoE activity)
VTGVQENTPAKQAGLVVGDVVVSVNAIRLSEESAIKGFQKAVMERKPGQVVELEILRGGELKKFQVTLGVRPMGLPDPSTIPDFENLQGLQGLQAIPGFRFNPLQPGPELLKAQEEKMKADEKKAKEECFETWLKEQRARGGKP